ncbi:type I-E CRISPR-associated protein Cas5/CasD [Streptomyces sp. NPDC002506]|uniref:type I-E CRISPR-associated protein Cas5/CasD n=1 Tax=Streptomyces sp. NPDC002506 TaxID=3154536 RepID=UPI003322E5DD
MSSHAVLTLQLAGPLQSWGASARFTRRTTEPAPTKSGVIGLLASALGRSRDSDISDLAQLRFGVRVDQAGSRLRDFHTAHHPDTGTSMPVSERFYLTDAVFVAAVEGDPQLLAALHQALHHPHYLPYLGRRSCPPSRPIPLKLHPSSELEQVLTDEPWRASPWYQRRRRHERDISLRLLTEAGPTTGHDPTAALHPVGDTVRDQPLTFSPRHRQYALRTVRTTTVTVHNPAARPARSDAASAPAHDVTGHLTEVTD